MYLLGNSFCNNFCSTRVGVINISHKLWVDAFLKEATINKETTIFIFLMQFGVPESNLKSKSFNLFFIVVDDSINYVAMFKRFGGVCANCCCPMSLNNLFPFAKIEKYECTSIKQPKNALVRIFTNIGYDGNKKHL